MASELNIVSFALLALAAVSYARKERCVLRAAGALFFPVTAFATVDVWWPVSPTAGAIILALTLGLSLVLLALFAVDVIWAPFCVEMTYFALVCWILCPLAVLLNYVGLAVWALSGRSGAV